MRPTNNARNGLTLTEVLVVIGILGVLAALLLPALLRARVAMRRTQCASRLGQLGLAMNLYHDQYDMFPGVNPDTAVRPPNQGLSHGWSFHVGLLPYLEHDSMYHRLDFRYPPGILESGVAEMKRLDTFLCPSDGSVQGPTTNYVVSFGTWVHRARKLKPGESPFDGIFNPQPDRPVTRTRVTDGLTNTVAMSETLQGPSDERLRKIFDHSEVKKTGGDGRPDQFRRACEALSASTTQVLGISKGGMWVNGPPPETAYNHVMCPNHNSCVWGSTPVEWGIAASSHHGRGVNAAMADGSARFFNQRIAADVWWALGSIAGGEAVNF